MLEGRTLWELIERRAADTPDAEMAVDEDGRRLTFRQYHDACERAAAGLAARGVGEGDVVSWQLPTWIESLVLVGALAGYYHRLDGPLMRFVDILMSIPGLFLLLTIIVVTNKLAKHPIWAIG